MQHIRIKREKWGGVFCGKLVSAFNKIYKHEVSPMIKRGNKKYICIQCLKIMESKKAK